MVKNKNKVRISHRNDRVNSKMYGPGTIIDSNERVTKVLFDDGAEMRFPTDAIYSSRYFDIQYEKSAQKLKINRIVIENLFDWLHYDININIDNNVSILSGPNGCGKTTIFKLLKFVFDPKERTFEEIKKIPFSKLSCYLSNGKTVSLIRENLEFKKDKKEKRSTSFQYDLAISLLGCDFVFKIDDVREESCDSISFTQAIEDQMNAMMHSYSYSDDVDLPDYLSGFFRRRTTSNFYAWTNLLQKKLVEHGCKINIDFIKANRLQREYLSKSSRPYSYRDDSRSNHEKEPEKIDYLNYANDEMTIDINNWLQEYNRKLAEAKNRLPDMYIQSSDIAKTDNYTSFRNRWNEYHQELKKFYEIGLLDSTEEVIAPEDFETAYEKKGSFLETYLRAFEGTLEPLKEHYDKLKLFADIFNKRNEITQKTVKFTADGIKIYSRNKEISREYLSSGEKNDFIMFYRLIFNTPQNGIVLIDEPEISLHIEWQEEYLDKLIEICKMNGIQAIVATHSPNIVNGHLDLFVEKR